MKRIGMAAMVLLALAALGLAGCDAVATAVMQATGAALVPM